MLPIANVHLKDLYDSTRDFIIQHSPRLANPFRALASDDVSDLGSAIGSTATHSDPCVHPSTPAHTQFLREVRGCPSECSCSDCTAPDPPFPVTPSLPTSPTHSMRKHSRDLDPIGNHVKAELARSNADVHRLEERCKVLEKTLRETKEILRARDAEIERMRRERAEEHRIRRGEQQQAAALAAKLAAQSRRSSGSSDLPDHPPPVPPKRAANGYIQNVLPIGVVEHDEDDEETSSEESGTDSEEEREHMRGLETFLTKIDRWSGAQIIQALQDLNSEILQFAASATELCTFDKYSRASPARTTQATKETAARLGPSLARVLSSRDHAQDPILVQLALQSCVATCISRAMSTFCFGFAAKPNAVLSQIYAQMYETGVYRYPPSLSSFDADTHDRGPIDIKSLACAHPPTHPRAPPPARGFCRERPHRDHLPLVIGHLYHFWMFEPPKSVNHNRGPSRALWHAGAPDIQRRVQAGKDHARGNHVHEL